MKKDIVLQKATPYICYPALFREVSMRSTILLMITACLFISTLRPALAQAESWPGYPADLPDYTYAGDDLKAHWPELTALIHITYPDEAWVKDTLDTYPDLKKGMLEAASDPDSDPALADLKDEDFAPLASQLQQVWRLHYAGKYQQAYDLGITLGPLGETAANYARLINASFIVTDKNVKLAEFRACERSSQATLKLAPDYALADYGLVYARVRILELLDTAQARETGYIDFAQQELKKLMKRYPDEPVYSVTQGGLEAGIVQRVGSLLATLTYGVSEDSAIAAFNTALQSPKARRPTVFHEFATAMQRISPSNYKDSIAQLLSLCATADVTSAEEALVKRECMAQL